MEERERFLSKTARADLIAAAHYEAERAEKREEAGSFYGKVRDLIEGGRAEEALPLLKARLDTHSQSWRLWFMLGWTLRCAGRAVDAEAALKTSLELFAPASRARHAAHVYTDIQNELAISLLDQGKTDEARRVLESALEKTPRNTKIISNLGVLALKEGRPEEAARFFKTVLDLDPNDPLAQRYAFLPEKI
jgi:Flp pilus assembly protein TadD